MEMFRKLIVIGNAKGVTIDNKVVAVLGLKIGDLLKVTVEKVSNES